MNNPNKAVVAGHICLDIIPNFDDVPRGKFFDLFQPGLMLQIGPPFFSTGGPVSNTGLALHILGVETYLMGKVGQDMYGQKILSILRGFDEKLTCGMVVEPTETTSYTIIISPPGIDRMFLHHPGANDTFNATDINYEKLNDASIFHFGYPPVMARIHKNNGIELTELFKRAKSTGITTSLDMCFPDPGSAGGKVDWPTVYKQTLPYVDIFSPSIEELLFTLHREIYEKFTNQGGSRFVHLVSTQLLDELSDELLDLGTKVILIKLGEYGAYLKTAHQQIMENFGKALPSNIKQWSHRQLWAPCFKVNVAGTTGSGDATIAGFLCALMHDMNPEDALNSAVAVGAFNVEAADAISGLRSWEETQSRISAGWMHHPLDLDSDENWVWDKNHNLWVYQVI